MEAPLQPHPGTDEIDLLAYWQVLVRRWKVIAGVVFVLTCAAIAAALLMTPIYRAKAVVVPVEDGESGGGMGALAGQLGGLASLAGVSLPSGGGGKYQVEVMTSRAFTVRLVEDNDLLPLLFPDQWDDVRRVWTVPEEDVPTLWDAYRTFEDIRTVSQDRKTGLVTLSIDHPDPDFAAMLVGLHIDTLNRFLQAKAIAEAQQSIVFLTEQAEQTGNVEMRQTLFRLIEAQTKRSVLARVRDDYALRVIDPPVPPDIPERPKKKLIVLLAVVVAGFLGVLLAFFLEFIASRPAQAPDDQP